MPLHTALPVSLQGSKIVSAGMMQRWPFLHALRQLGSVATVSLRALYVLRP